MVETTDETSGGSHDAQNPFPNLLNEAILAPGQNGMTPLHSLIASFCDVTDVKNMSLFVSRLPQNFTAQQLLRLFQKRYPSAYKAEIMKEEEREGSDLGECGRSERGGSDVGECVSCEREGSDVGECGIGEREWREVMLSMTLVRIQLHRAQDID